MATSPQNQYDTLLANQEIQASAQQAEIVTQLQLIHEQLTGNNSSSLMKRILKKGEPISGLYLWGEVGIGKTFLIDLLYKTLDIAKLRQHFHVFMKEMHAQLHAIQGTKDPLKVVAKSVAEKCRVLFLDEFIVSDICDAMVLAEFLDALFQNNVTLITTSNTEPDKLYQYGFQREKFLPAIAHIKQHTKVIHLTSDCDYRRIASNTQAGYFMPGSSPQLKAAFESYNKDHACTAEDWELCGRNVSVMQSSDIAVWFDFKTLCNPPRSQLDYIEISQRVKHLFLSGVPKLNMNLVNQVSLFTKLIDVLYDEGIQLTIAADVPVDEIYPAGELAKEFERTRSRIVEMTST